MASKRVLVTGGSAGIGQATCQVFAENGWHVITTSRRGDGEGDYRWVALDLNESSSIQRCAEEVLAEGTPDVVVHNAGYGLISPIETADLDAVKDQFQANVFGTLDLAQRLLPAMREQGQGVQAAVTSIGGRMAFPFFGYYNASKHALEAAFESLHHELRHSPLEVRIIEPGFTQTQFATHRMEKRYRDEPYYAAGLDGLAKRLETGNTGTDPRVLGQLIFNACTQKSGLRHHAGALAGPLLWARRWLPEKWFLNLVGQATNPSS